MPRIDPLQEVERALLRVILEKGNQCVSQASLKTGHGTTALLAARDSLVRRGLIKEVPGQSHRELVFRSYEPKL